MSNIIDFRKSPAPMSPEEQEYFDYIMERIENDELEWKVDEARMERIQEATAKMKAALSQLSLGLKVYVEQDWEPCSIYAVTFTGVELCAISKELAAVLDALKEADAVSIDGGRPDGRVTLTLEFFGVAIPIL